MNKKKITTIVLLAAFLAIAVTGGTLAYFTDTDAQENVMTVGNVKITQNENQRTRDAQGNLIHKYGTIGGLEVYSQDEALHPAVCYNGDEVIKTVPNYDGTLTIGVWTADVWTDNSVKNLRDKIVTVTNDGNNDVYVRTLFAFEDNATGTITPAIHTLWNGADEYYGAKDANIWPSNGSEWLTINDGETTYNVCVFTYKNVLPTETTSNPSLISLWLDSSVDNDWSGLVGDDYKVIALTQAVQAEGFNDAVKALNAAFGEVTVANTAEVANWFDNDECDFNAGAFVPAQ